MRWHMGIGSVLDLANGVFKRFFSKEAKDENRANEIEQLEKEQLEYSKKNAGGIYNARLNFISRRLSELNREAKNNR